MNLVQRVQDILLKPKDTWPVIATEPGDAAALYKDYLIYLALVPAVAGFIGMSLFGIGDEDVSGKIEVDKKRLLGITDQVVVQQAQEKTCTIRKRSGTDVIEVPIPCTN